MRREDMLVTAVSIITVMIFLAIGVALIGESVHHTYCLFKVDETICKSKQ